MKTKIALIMIALAFCCIGCKEYTEEEIDAMNAKSREEVSKPPETRGKIKSSGSVIAKNVGGYAEIELPPNNKLTLVTWKDDNLWILYRPMRKDEEPEVYVYREDSQFNLIEAYYKVKNKEME